MNELKPCPNPQCESEDDPSVYRGRYAWHVECVSHDDHPHSASYGSSCEEAIAKWNAVPRVVNLFWANVTVAAMMAARNLMELEAVFALSMLRKMLTAAYKPEWLEGEALQEVTTEVHLYIDEVAHSTGLCEPMTEA